MGTTLTGTTPQDTYDSLIKVTDNGPLSGSLKTLTDGLGNDSALALSTGAASITGTLAVTGNATFDTSTLVVDATNNRVGIGTATPASILQLEKSSDSGSASTFPSLQVKNTLATQGDGSSTFNFSNLNLSSGDGAVNMFLLTTYAAGTWAPSAQLSVSTNHPLVFKTNNTEVARLTTAGVLDLNQGQIKFPATQVASADANTLDDYEEGTWTPTVVGTTGTATYTTREGHYTKIGRQVTVTFFISFQKASIAGSVTLASLPFTVGNLGNQYPQAAILIDNLASAYDNPILQLNNGDTSGFLLINNGSTVSHAAMDASQLGAGTMTFRGTATYFV